ncbi:MAG: glycosyltransferase 87 family protein [Actinomycetota bacterium]|nr:glycosyltransferase 87 family protein [Actinomycetota bacterium]
MKRSAACCAALLIGLLLAAAPAGAQERTHGGPPGLRAGTPTPPPVPDGLTTPKRDDVAPPGRRLTAARAGRIADAIEAIADERLEYPGSKREVYLKGTDRWQVSYFAKVAPGDPRKEIAQVLIDDRSGRVLEAWTDYKVAWSMARGYPGAFGRIVNAPWVWIPLALLFVVPFVDPRRLLRVMHLDLLVLSAFSVSLALFNDAQIDTSVPLVYPLLLYLLGRMLWIGLRRRGAAEQQRRPLRLLVPVSWLAIAVVFLIGFRVALNVTKSNVIDVGYAGVIGADRFVDGRELYGAYPDDNAYGDTYGPVTYIAYVPFEQAMKWTGTWDELPAAHGAALAFDLLACLLCFLLGRRVRGPALGVALAYAWVSFPFTLYVLMTNANDALVVVLVLAAVWAAGSAPARGALTALAGLTKFAPLALAPLLATYPRPRLRTIAWFAVGFAVAAALAFVPVFAHNDLRSFWDATIGFQAQRGSPFSVWGLYDPDVGWLDVAQRAVQVGATLLALALAFVPHRRDIVGLAALSAAILIALQLGVTHWFYLYIPWFFPLVMLALVGRWGEPARS